MSNVKFQIVKSPKEGYGLAKEILYKKSDKNTVLFLSGGSTPKPLYKKLATERKLKVGAVAMVDDRYGLPMHANSNERMIANTGLFKYLRDANIPIYLQLKSGLSLEKTTEKYDSDVRFLLSKFPKRIAVLGIGADGHIASIGPRSNDLNHDIKLVVGIDDFPAEIRERVTLTLKALLMFDLLIVLAFEKEKREGIKIALKTFFKGQIGSALAKKTILITNNPISQLICLFVYSSIRLL